jgi:hypothetical protein
LSWNIIEYLGHVIVIEDIRAAMTSAPIGSWKEGRLTLSAQDLPRWYWRATLGAATSIGDKPLSENESVK